MKALFADYTTILQRAAVLAEGSYHEVSKTLLVIEAYMGGCGGENHLARRKFALRDGEAVTLFGRNGTYRTPS